MASVKTLAFHIVDVFAVEPLTGNPLAVVDGGTELTLDLFQRIAVSSPSETVFLPPTRPQADWRLRSFTAAGVEVFGAGGHNSLGAWWWLAEAGKLALTRNATSFHQEIGDRVLPVTISQAEGRLSRVVMDQEPPVAGSQLNDVATLAASIGLTVADLAVDRVPCQVISTGVAHLMVPIRDRDAVDRIEPDAKALFAMLHSMSARRDAMRSAWIRAGPKLSRMRGSSIRRWGSGKIQRPAPRPAPWPLIWSPMASPTRGT